MLWPIDGKVMINGYTCYSSALQRESIFVASLNEKAF